MILKFVGELHPDAAAATALDCGSCCCRREDLHRAPFVVQSMTVDGTDVSDIVLHCELLCPFLGLNMAAMKQHYLVAVKQQWSTHWGALARPHQEDACVS